MAWANCSFYYLYCSAHIAWLIYSDFFFFLGTFSSNTLPQECIGNILSKTYHFQKLFSFSFTFSNISCLVLYLVLASHLLWYQSLFFQICIIIALLCLTFRIVFPLLSFLLPSSLLPDLPFFSIFFIFPFLPYFLLGSLEWFSLYL